MATPAVTWATVEEVAAEVGVPPATAAGDARLVAATEASNAFCWRRRQAAGYTGDDPTVSPGPDVTEAVVLYAAALYRMRGATDGFASFADVPPELAAGGTMPQVYRLLGTNRPVVA